MGVTAEDRGRTAGFATRPRRAPGDVLGGLCGWLLVSAALLPVLVTAVWTGGAAGSALTAHGWDFPEPTPHALRSFVTGGTDTLWPDTPRAAAVTGIALSCGVAFGGCAGALLAVDRCVARLRTFRRAGRGTT